MIKRTASYLDSLSVPGDGLVKALLRLEKSINENAISSKLKMVDYG